MLNVKTQIQKMNLSQLNELSQFIREVKVMNAKASITVGQKVYVVQKTKRQLGVVEKINQTKCLVNLSGTVYRVPMSMLEAA